MAGTFMLITSQAAARAVTSPQCEAGGGGGCRACAPCLRRTRPPQPARPPPPLPPLRHRSAPPTTNNGSLLLPPPFQSFPILIGIMVIRKQTLLDLISHQPMARSPSQTD